MLLRRPASKTSSSGKRPPALLLIPLTLGIAAIGALIFVVRKGNIRESIKNQYVILTGTIGSMVAVLFMLFRLIRFLVQLYP